MSDQQENAAALTEQVDRLRLLVEELQSAQAAQRSDDAGAERWQARLASLETRLSMVESTFRTEAERVQGAVRNVEALSASLRGAVDGAEAVAATGRALEDRIDQLDATLATNQPDTTTLAAEVGRRVEEVAQAPARAMTEALDEHLQRAAERERTVAAALESLTGQLNQFTTTLAGELRRAGQESAEASRSELDAAARSVAEAAAAVAAAGDVTPRVDLAIAGIGEVRQELAAVTSRLDPSARLDAITEATARIDARVAQSASAIAQQVREVLADRLAVGDPTPALEAMRADLRHAVRSLGEERTPGADLQGTIEAIAQDVAGLTARLDEVRTRAETTSRDLATLADVPTTLARLVEDLQPLASLPASMDGLGGAVEGAVAVHRRSAAAVETLQESIDAARAEVGEAAGATNHLTQRLDDAAVAAAEANRVALEAALAHQRELEATRAAGQQGQLASLTAAIERLVAQPSIDASLVPLLREVQEELAAHRADQATAAEATKARLDALADAVTAAASGPAPLTVEQLDGALAALSSSLTDGPALASAEDLEVAVAKVVGAVAALPTPASPAELEAAISRLETRLADAPTPASPAALQAAATTLEAGIAALASAPAPASAAELQAAVSRLETRFADLPTPVSTTELDAAVAGLRLAISSQPVPPGVDEVAAAVRVTLPEMPATAADIETATTRLLATLDARLAGGIVEELRAEIARIVEFRAEVLGAVADLRDGEVLPLPAGMASAEDVQAAAEGVVGAVRDALAGVLVELGSRGQGEGITVDPDAIVEVIATIRGDLELVRRSVEARGDPLPAIEAVAATLDAARYEIWTMGQAQASEDNGTRLDAIGRLVHHAINSLHLIEESTVGVSSESTKARAEVGAALAQLEAARHARDVSKLG